MESLSLDNSLHFLHVIAAIAWTGGGLTLSVIALRIRSSGDIRAMADFARTLPYVGLRVLMPAVIVIPVTGVWMVLENSEFQFAQLWVRFGIGLFLLAFLIGAVYMSRVGIQLDRAARQAAGAAINLSALLDRWLAGYAVVMAVLLLAIADMVFKPGT